MIKSIIPLLCLLPVQALADGSRLVLGADCRSRDCVEMILNWGDEKPDYIAEPSPPHQKRYTFEVSGRLNGEDEARHEIEFAGYANGLNCSDFGQGNVAVQGIEEGRPILGNVQGSAGSHRWFARSRMPGLHSDRGHDVEETIEVLPLSLLGIIAGRLPAWHHRTVSQLRCRQQRLLEERRRSLSRVQTGRIDIRSGLGPMRRNG